VARLDTGWCVHPKILALSMAGMAVHAWSISYCDLTRSDGFIPEGVWPSKRGFAEGIKDVVKAGLWVACEGGYQLHDFTVYNRTKAQIELAQAEDRARKTPTSPLDSGRNPNGFPRARAQTRSGNPVPVPGATPQGTVDPLNPPETDLAGAGVGDGADGAPPRASPPRAENRDDDDPVQVLREGMAICPLCRLPYQGAYVDHTSDKHKVRPVAEPGNLHFRRRRAGEPEPDAPPPDIEVQFEAMHERLQSMPQTPP